MTDNNAFSRNGSRPAAAEALPCYKLWGFAPAFFFLLAVILSGLRSSGSWAVFCAAFFLCAAFLNKRAPLFLGGLWPWFFGWLALASVFSPEPLNSFSHFSKYIVFAFFLSGASQGGAGEARLGSRRVNAAALAWMLSLFGAGLVCASALLYQRITGSGTDGVIGNNPNYSAAVIAGGFAAAWALMFLEKTGRRQALYGLLCAVFLAALVVANSRGAMLASLLSAAAFLAVNRQWRPLLYMAAALVLAAAIAPPDWLTFSLKADDPRAYSRVWLWKSALEAALERPFFGFGPGLFERAFEVFKFPYFNGVSYYGHSTIHAHSEVLNLAAEAGFPAAAAFTGAFFYSVREKSRDAFQCAAKFCAVALFIQGACDMVFYSGAVALLFFGSAGFASGGGPEQNVRCSWFRRPRAQALIAGALCLLGLFPRLVFERDLSLALGPADGTGKGALSLRRALGFAPHKKELLFEAARAGLGSSGNYAYAAALAENAAVFCPKDATLPYLAAEALMRGGDASAAKQRLEAALALEPGFIGARAALAGLLRSEGSSRAAVAQEALAEKALSSAAPPRSVYDMRITGAAWAGGKK